MATATSTARKAAAKKAQAVKGAVKATGTERTSPRIMSAPKGVRTLSHNAIKQAVEKVFAGR